MPAHKFKIEIAQGATYVWETAWSVSPKKGAPFVLVDLTGCTARAQIRSEIDSPEVLLELTTENGRIELGGSAGTIRILIDAVTTAGITWDSGVYDLEVVFADGTVVRRLAGSVSVSKGVTRDA
jgi:hypothetical protein